MWVWNHSNAMNPMDHSRTRHELFLNEEDESIMMRPAWLIDTTRYMSI